LAIKFGAMVNPSAPEQGITHEILMEI